MFISKIVLCAVVLMSGEPQATKPNARGATLSDKGDSPIFAETKIGTVPKAAQPVVQPELAEKEVDGVKLRAIEANIVSYTNEQRVRYGLPPLEVDKELMATAREHASWMTRTRNMVHTRLAVAENIAMGQPHSSDAVQAWMNSSGHRANILNASHRRIGVAAFRTESGTIYWCQQFRQ